MTRNSFNNEAWQYFYCMTLIISCYILCLCFSCISHIYDGDIFEKRRRPSYAALLINIIFFLLQNKKESWHFMCNTKEAAKKNMNAYLCCIEKKIEESVACEERSQQEEETLYIVSSSSSLYRWYWMTDWFHCVLSAMGDSSVYSRFFSATMITYVIIFILRWQNYVHLCMHERLFWRCTISWKKKSWRTGVRNKKNFFARTLKWFLFNLLSFFISKGEK